MSTQKNSKPSTSLLTKYLKKLPLGKLGKEIMEAAERRLKEKNLQK